jgi:glucans biosynthesis protein
MLPMTETPFAISRRALTLGSVALAGLAGGGWPRMAPAAEGLPAGSAFSFDILTQWMRDRAGRPWVEPVPPEGFLGTLDYDAYRLIQFRDRRARWQEAGDRFRLQAFHTGWLFGEPVQLYDVSSGTVQPVLFTTADFDYRGTLKAQVPADAPLPGVAGFRLLHPLNRPDRFDEIVAFLGASYFRALGRGNAYGLSARGLALNTATGSAEEFPRFSAFYLERPAPGAGSVALSAALDSPSVTGAYRFVITPGRDTVMEVEARLFFREAVESVGVAPLTSMFLFDDKNRAAFDDFRPRVHDSEGLAIVQADGGRVWRPLNNPPALANSWFAGLPRRFGLHQRTRGFGAYQDPEARYEARPSLEVEPLGDWGPGAVRLVEIPTDLEVNDNIVAFWEGRTPGAAAGDARVLRYRLHWGNLDRAEADTLARVVAMRAGAGGVSGVASPEDTRKFVIDFAGPGLDGLDPEARIEAAVTISRGEIRAQALEALPGAGLWRLVIDAHAPGAGVAELTAHLNGYGARLTETWAYQWMHR